MILTDLLLFPFRVLGKLVQLVGRIAAALLGLVLMAAGLLLTFTIALAWIGIPLTVLGFLLLIRSLF